MYGLNTQDSNVYLKEGSSLPVLCSTTSCLSGFYCEKYCECQCVTLHFHMHVFPCWTHIHLHIIQWWTDLIPKQIHHSKTSLLMSGSQGLRSAVRPPDSSRWLSNSCNWSHRGEGSNNPAVVPVLFDASAWKHWWLPDDFLTRASFLIVLGLIKVFWRLNNLKRWKLQRLNQIFHFLIPLPLRWASN